MTKEACDTPRDGVVAVLAEYIETSVSTSEAKRDATTALSLIAPSEGGAA